MEWKYTHTFTLPSSPARVFSALTSQAELQRWFAEYAEVDARSGGVLRAWGRHTYGTATSPTGRISTFEADKELAFEWLFDGVPSHVRWTLAADGDAADKTKLTVEHAFERPLGIAHEKELVDDLWRLTMGNLDAHLRGGAGIVLPDYTSPHPEIRMSMVVNAPREKVFRALTDPAALARWFTIPNARTPRVEPRPGGVYDLGWEYPMGGRQVKAGTSTIIEYVENEKLVTDWLDWRGDTTRAPHRLTWLLESLGEQTRVTFIHDGFKRASDMSDYPFGWPYFIGMLQKEFETAA